MLIFKGWGKGFALHSKSTRKHWESYTILNFLYPSSEIRKIPLLLRKKPYQNKLQILISISYLVSYWKGFRIKLFYGSVWIIVLMGLIITSTQRKSGDFRQKYACQGWSAVEPSVQGSQPGSEAGLRDVTHTNPPHKRLIQPKPRSDSVIYNEEYNQ